MNPKAIILIAVLSMLPAKVSAAGETYSLEEIGISYGHGIDVGHWFQIDFIQHVIPPLHFLEEWIHEPYLDIGIAGSKWKESGLIAYHISSNLMVRSHNIPTAVGNMFFEAGFGPHLFSKPGETRRLATAFEFNSFAGIGLRLTDKWALVARARHLSNAGITESNSGVNLYLLQLHYHFEH